MAKHPFITPGMEIGIKTNNTVSFGEFVMYVTGLYHADFPTEGTSLKFLKHKIDTT